MTELLRLAKDLGLPLVATNDLHYTHAADASSHAALLCVQSGSTLDDPNRFKFDTDEFYLKTPAQMRELFRDYPEACDNTLLIAERAEVAFDTSANYMPRYPVPEGETENSWFVQEVERGLDLVGIEERIPQLVRQVQRRHPRRPQLVESRRRPIVGKALDHASGLDQGVVAPERRRAMPRHTTHSQPPPCDALLGDVDADHRRLR